jgi:hypothetical protein
MRLVALVCALLGHALPRGLRRELSIFYNCARCGELVRGGFRAGRRA